MTYEPSASQMNTVTAIFDDRTDAAEAVERLAQAGIARDRIRLVEGSERGSDSLSYSDSHPGFWESLKDIFMPDEDRYTYAEGLRRGGYLVTATVNEADYDRAIDILDDEGTIDLDERAESWRSEGWTGYEAGSSASLGATDLRGGSTMGLSGESRSRTDFGSHDAGAEEVIPVAEEELRVGERDVSHGRVRVRSYVVETPVTEDVSLREEHVRVERRPVDRAVTSGDRLFQDRTIEMDERAEEAVVSKEARVREELVINKDVSSRTKTISDTVRRTEVDVEDERGTVVSRSNDLDEDIDRDIAPKR